MNSLSQERQARTDDLFFKEIVHSFLSVSNHITTELEQKFVAFLLGGVLTRDLVSHVTKIYNKCTLYIILQ